MDPTRQLQLCHADGFSLTSLQCLVTKISNMVQQFTTKQINLQTISITEDREVAASRKLFLTFNKIKAAIMFHDAFSCISHENPFIDISISFTRETFGAFDRTVKTLGTQLFVSNCFSTSITGSEIKALREVYTIVNQLLEKNNFQPLTMQSISLSKCFVYLGFPCTESLEVIKKILSQPEWKSPKPIEYPFTGEIHWNIERANALPIRNYSKTQEAKQIYYSTKTVDKIPGLKLQEDLVTKEQEQEIMQWTERDGGQYWENRVQGKKNPMKRRVQHYGYRFNYETNFADEMDEEDQVELPAIFQPIIDELVKKKLITQRPNQLTINEYKEGQGILSHIDTHSAFYDEIISVSLGSDCGMEFCRYDAKRTKLGVYLPTLSALVLTGESRYAWKHGITKKSFDHVLVPSEEVIGGMMETFYPSAELRKRGKRVSLTFRTVRVHRLCECAWPSPCDYQVEKAPKKAGKACEMEDAMQKSLQANTEEGEKLGKELERKHVLEFYETAAEHFSNTRHSPWPLISRFLTLKNEKSPSDLEEYNGITNDMFIADVGCGNGKYLRCIPSSMVAVGTDISANLLAQSKKLGTHSHDLFVADGLALPFRDELFDVSLCIAVFHHISTKARRLTLASELLRILKPGGRLLVYAWAFEQEKDQVGSRKFPQQDCFVPWHLSTQNNKTENEHVLQRYCHVFIQGELESLFKEAGDVLVLNSYNDHSNWAVLVQKQ